MRSRDVRQQRFPRRPAARRVLALVAAVLASALPTGSALAGPPPPPPSPPRDAPPPPPGVRPPVYVPVPVAPAHRPSDPPPLPVAVRVIYAPFYVAGLIVRYGVYYALVAPFEVLFRTIQYGASGGVDPAPGSNQGP